MRQPAHILSIEGESQSVLFKFAVDRRQNKEMRITFEKRGEKPCISSDHPSKLILDNSSVKESLTDG